MNPNSEGSPQIPDHVLLRRIGKGAYGEVWLARNMTGAFRAVKVIHRQTFADERPFQREFEGICKFEPISRSHPALVTILHVGQNSSAGYFFYVMEVADDARTGQIIDVNSYVPKTLREELSNQRRPPLHKQIEIALSLTSGLEYLHARNLIHRDIKPPNIIFVNGLAKFADVGLIIEAGEDVSAVCTPGFMPPEGPGAPTGDIFSLGKVFYELFMGLAAKRFPELPGKAEEFTAIPALLQVNQLVLKACDPDPRQRFQTAVELRHALLAVTEMIHEKQPGAGASNAASSDSRKAGVGAGTRTPRSRSEADAGREGESAMMGEPRVNARWTRRVAFLVLLLAIAGATFVLTNRWKPVAAAIPTGGPVIFLMDTVAPRGVYDSDNIRKGRSNADELLERLAGLDGTVSLTNLNKEAIGLDWARDSFVAAKRPDIVIIHRSSFFHPFAAELNLPYPPFATKEELERWRAIYDSKDATLQAFIRTVGALVPHTQFLIYSTGTDERWLKPEYRADWVKRLERDEPALEGRINVMEIRPRPNEGKGTFRNEETMEEVRTHVREMLKKLEKHKPQKAK